MGDTLRFAERMNLVEMEPRAELSSTGYARVSPGSEYLVLEPSEAAGPFTVTLAAGTYTGQWYSVDRRETVPAGEVTVESSTTVSFTAPFEAAGPALLYLKTVGRKP